MHTPISLQSRLCRLGLDFTLKGVKSDQATPWFFSQFLSKIGQKLAMGPGAQDEIFLKIFQNLVLINYSKLSMIV